MAPVVTVDCLLDLLQKLHNAGNGDMKIKCSDNFIHEDEIGINYMNNEMQFRGLIYNFPITARIKEFDKDIERAYRKFYGISESEGSGR